MHITATRTLALVAATALMLSACGADEPDGAGASTAAPRSDTPTDDGLRPPVPVTVRADGSAPGRQAATGMPEGDAATFDAAGPDVGLTVLPWFNGWEFVVDASMPDLPDAAIGYELPPGAPLEAETVARIAAVLGIDGEVVAGSEAEGVRWRVGPDDGTEPSLVVLDDGPLSWYRSDAWALDTGRWDCVIEVEPWEGEPTPDGDEPMSDSVEVTPDGDEPWETCPEPEPPTGILTASEAEAEARRLLAELGLDASSFEFETWADEWHASVTAWSIGSGIRWPLAYGFGFGAEGSLGWANGSAATPLATGPYPLIGLDEALDRLDQQGWWGVASARAVPEPGLAAIDVADEPVGSDEREIALLVDVRADLWWSYSEDGTVWLLPAYTFIDSEGRWHTVPAVTDEYLVVEEPMIMIDPPLDIDDIDGNDGSDGIGGFDEFEEFDAAQFEELVGLAVDEAEAVLAEQGRTLRVLRLDGADQMATMDYVPSRINVAVVDGLVTEILSNG